MVSFENAPVLSVCQGLIRADQSGVLRLVMMKIIPTPSHIFACFFLDFGARSPTFATDSRVVELVIRSPIRLSGPPDCQHHDTNVQSVIVHTVPEAYFQGSNSPQIAKLDKYMRLCKQLYIYCIY